MGAILARELIAAARKPALQTVFAVHVAFLSAFVLVWHRGVPLGGAVPTLYDQGRILEGALLAVCLPWAAMRCMAVERGDDLTLSCALTATRPWAMVSAKAAGVACTLALLALGAAPVLIVAQQMSAVPVARPLVDQATFLGVAVLAAGVAVAWALRIRQRLWAWAGATISTCAALAIMAKWLGTGLPAGSMAAFVGLVSTIAAAAWSERAARYLQE
jgi:hypothetical protein